MRLCCISEIIRGLCRKPSGRNLGKSLQEKELGTPSEVNKNMNMLRKLTTLVICK